MSKGVKIRIKTQPAVVMEAEIARKIRQHSRSSMKAEVCGVLLGTAENDRTLVEACIAGINAAQGGAHVTFTQDTWEHIYKIKDQQYPEMKIVGWYHSHPGFGVFLSEHDLFIQENFFSNPQQIAWVYDPHTDEEGCFGWVGGKIEKLSGVRFGYLQSVDASETTVEDQEGESAGLDPDPVINLRPRRSDNEPAWVKWASQSLAYVAVLGLGFASGYMFLQWRWGPALNACQQSLPAIAACEAMVRNPVEACNEILRMGTPSNLPPGPEIPDSLKPSPSLPKHDKPSAGKGTNGKH